MAATSGPLPALRADLEVFPVESNGEKLFCLRDRLEPGSALVLSQAAVKLASLLDGERDQPQLVADFLMHTGARLPEKDVTSFVEHLDQAFLLDSPRLRRRLARQRRAFFLSEERPAFHAGDAYPSDPAELGRFLASFYTHPDGPGSPPTGRSGRLSRGLIAPHIDLHRGGPTYAWTYKALAESDPADTYLLLGTCHTPMQNALALTRKPYGTPLGPAPVDFDFIERFTDRHPGDIFGDELSHRAEHSLEFQALYLRYLDLVGGAGGGRVVPVLCGSLYEWASPGQSPLSVPEIAASVEALRQTVLDTPAQVCVVAGVDFAHVGPQFGDPVPLNSAALETVGRGDAEMLDTIQCADAEAFYQQVMRDGDARRICGLSPIYYLLHILSPAQGRLLKYSQWVDPLGNGSVTFAGVIFDE